METAGLRLGLAVAVLVVFVAGIGAAVARNLDDGSEVVVARVFLEPDASETDWEAVGRVLEADRAVKTVRFISQAAAYEEYRQLFADEPEFQETVGPDDLPPSYEITCDADAFDRLREIAASPVVAQVRRVEQ